MNGCTHSPSSMDTRCASSCRDGVPAVTSVKWLTEIKVISELFTGHYQSDVYHYEWQRNGEMVREPVTLQRVRSLITEPDANNELERGEVAIRGVAWSGAESIARVEVSIANGPWQQTRLIGKRSRHSWQWWELVARIDSVGTTTIRARALDLAGNRQAEQPEWNQSLPPAQTSFSARRPTESNSKVSSRPSNILHSFASCRSENRWRRDEVRGPVSKFRNRPNTRQNHAFEESLSARLIGSLPVRLGTVEATLVRDGVAAKNQIDRLPASFAHDRLGCAL